eukprot:1142131-Pelagomonas_calceolata.AAC.1
MADLPPTHNWQMAAGSNTRGSANVSSSPLLLPPMPQLLLLLLPLAVVRSVLAETVVSKWGRRAASRAGQPRTKSCACRLAVSSTGDSKGQNGGSGTAGSAGDGAVGGAAAAAQLSPQRLITCTAVSMCAGDADTKLQQGPSRGCGGDVGCTDKWPPGSAAIQSPGGAGAAGVVGDPDSAAAAAAVLCVRVLLHRGETGGGWGAGV